jgi:hypothetical protein
VRPRLRLPLEEALSGTLRKARAHRFLARLPLLATVFLLLYLGLEVAVLARLFESGFLFVSAVALLFCVGIVAFLGLLVLSLTEGRSRSWLASELERAQPDLGDRLNAAIDIERRKHEPEIAGYFERIEDQAVALIGPERPSFANEPLKRRWAGALLALLALVLVHQWTDPWAKLDFGFDERSPRRGEAEELKLPDPEAAASENAPNWGEVRITEPGRDLRVTKVDVVPLQIEAASSGALKSALWRTAKGGKTPESHPLPAPREPHYAVYAPSLYVDEFRLSDWDVLSYSAAAATSEGKSYASEIYFLEVRPFREDIAKLPGGEGGNAYDMLKELSELIDRQKQVIRETHHFLARTYPTPAQRTQDEALLGSGEADVLQATRHTYARIAAYLENHGVGGVLDALGLAQEHLAQATHALRSDLPTAPELEGQALEDLVATRKALQKAITENPGAFQEGSGTLDGADEPVPDLEGKLKQISEFRDEEKAVGKALEELVADQRALQRKVEGASPAPHPDLAQDEEALRRRLSALGAEHPAPLKGAEREKAAADDALRNAASALDAPAPAGGATGRALDALSKLQQSVDRNAGGRALTHAYQLKEMVDGEAKALGKVEQNPDAQSREETGKVASGAEEATRELQRVVKDTAAKDAFGPPLHEALSPERQAARERALEALKSSSEPGERKRAAGRAKGDLEALSQAFEKSEPPTVGSLKSADPLKEGASEALDHAMHLLGSLGDASRPGEEKAKDEALLELKDGLEGLYGKNDQTRRLLLEARDAVKKVDLKVDPVRLKQLLDALEQFRVEMADRRLDKDQLPDLRHIDVSRLPPAYRERIQKYYERLSESR